MDELIESEMSTRRGLLHAFARGAARHARERVDLLGGDEFGPAPDESGTPARYSARAPMRAASLDEVLALAHAEGLTRRDHELRELARRSLRMTPTDGGHADAWIQIGEDAGATGEEVLLAAINLTAAGARGCPLPDQGWLALFVDSRDGLTANEARRAHGVLLDMAPAIPPAAEPVALHAELVIPRRWHELVQALELADDEAEAYDRLRARLQDLQGVENDADGGQSIAYHRLLGYPNETTGAMPEDSILALDDWAIAGGVEPDPVAPGLPSRECVLLAQVSIGGYRRAYVWIRRTDLEAGGFHRLCAFVR